MDAYCYWTLGTKLQWNFNQNPHILIPDNTVKMLSEKWQPYCLSLNVLTLMWYHCSVRKWTLNYRQTSNIRHTSTGKIFDHSDVVGASHVGIAPTTSSLSTWHLASTDFANTTARRDKKHLSFGFCVAYITDLIISHIMSWWPYIRWGWGSVIHITASNMTSPFTKMAFHRRICLMSALVTMIKLNFKHMILAQRQLGTAWLYFTWSKARYQVV